MNAAQSQRARRVLFLWAGIAILTIVFSARTMYLGGVNCDEFCPTPAADWTDTRTAWQWSLLSWLGLLGVTSVVAALVLLITSHGRAARGALGLGAMLSAIAVSVAIAAGLL